MNVKILSAPKREGKEAGMETQMVTLPSYASQDLPPTFWAC